MMKNGEARVLKAQLRKISTISDIRRRDGKEGSKKKNHVK